jgi:hypothetical protein
MSLSRKDYQALAQAMHDGYPQRYEARVQWAKD